MRLSFYLQALGLAGGAAAIPQAISARGAVPPPPAPEPVKITTLPLPPAIASNNTGACTKAVNPHMTGCMLPEKGFQGGSFMPDGNHVLAMITFVGAPEAPKPGSAYSGLQIIVVKTDGEKFSNGDAWKCITCGVPAKNSKGMSEALDYPQAFRDGKRALIGSNIIDCGKHDLVSENCRPANTNIYPIRWNVKADGSGAGGAMRELRIHPDDQHLAFSSFTINGVDVGQVGYFSRLKFNPSPTTGEPLAPRYDLVNVSVLVDIKGKQWYQVDGETLTINHDAIMVGELRGFSGDGTEITYVGPNTESSNTDIYAVHMQTGKVRRLTSHPDYCDPVSFSPDNKWMAIMDTRASQRMMWAAAMRNVPPVSDLITSLLTTGMRNNGERRFFQPFLLDRYGDRGDYYGQQINAQGDGIPGGGAYNDPEWNAQADPWWSLDGTRIVYYQVQTTSPECGGQNPLPCFKSTEPYSRHQRLLIATLTSRSPTKTPKVAVASDNIPWAMPYVAGTPVRQEFTMAAGNYTLKGQQGGSADIEIRQNADGWVNSMSVSYSNFTNDGKTFLNGNESANRTSDGRITNIGWLCNLTQTGAVHATKKSSAGGLVVESTLFTITGWTGNFTTTVDGEVYSIPQSDT